MEKTSQNKLMNDLALALIYLTAWKEKGDVVSRAWKGYDFSILDDLKEQGLIDFSYRAKSLYRVRMSNAPFRAGGLTFTF